MRAPRRDDRDGRSPATRRWSRSRGVLDEVSSLGPHLRLERTITTRTGAGDVELTDRVTNLGAEPEPAPLLYHVNLGAPLLGPAARVEIDGHAAGAARRSGARRAGCGGAGPRPAGRWPGADGDRARARVRGRGAGGRGARRRSRGPRSGRGVRTRRQRPSSASPSPCRGTAPGCRACGSGSTRGRGSTRSASSRRTARVLGRAADRAAGRLPVLEPGAERVTRVRVQAAPC